MDAAARAARARPGRAAPAQHDPAGADALQQPDGAGLRRRRSSRRSWTRAWRWPTGPASRPAPRRPAARGRLRGRGIATFLEWTGGNALVEQVTVRVTGRRLHRADRGDDGDGPGHRHQLRAAGGRRVRRADRAHPRAAGRHRPRQRLRQRRPAARCSPAARRCRWRPSKSVEHGKALAAEALEAPAADIEYRAGRFTRGRHRPGHRPVRARGAPARRRRFAVERRRHRRRAELAQRLPCLRGRDRPRHRRGARSSPMRRSTTSAASSARPSCGARSKAARCRASARRCARRCVYDPDSGQLLSASFMDYALPHADGFLGFKTAFDTSMPVHDQRAGRQGRGRARHHRRHAGGGQRGGRRAGAAPVTATRPLRLQMPLSSEKVWRALNG